MAVPYRRTPIAVAIALVAPTSHAVSIAPTGAAIPVATNGLPTAERRPAIAIDDDGNFVVVWDDDNTGTGIEVFARVFNADGSPRTSAFIVNTTTGSDQRNPAVAMDSDGDFVVAWESDYQTGYVSGEDVVYRRFNPDGSPAGGEIDVTASPGSTFVEADVDIADDGRVAVAWQDSTNNNVIAQVFDATDVALFAAAPVPQDTTPTSHDDPVIAFLVAGNYVVAWNAFTLASANDVFFRRFDVGGNPIDALDQRAHPTAADDELRAAIDADAAGNFVVAWGNWDQNNTYVRRFAADGSAITSPIQVVAAGTGGFIEPGVATDDDGDFAVSWSIGYADAAPGAYVRTFAPDGTPDGPAQAAAQDAANNYESGSVALDADGDAVVTWEEYADSDGTAGADVFARRFTTGSTSISGTASGPGSLGWLGLVGLGLAALGRRLFGRGRKRRGGLAGLLAGTLALGTLGGSPDVATAAELQTAGRVESARGTVTASRDDESRRSLAAGDPVYVGDRVRTGVGASAALRLADGTEVNLRANSEFRVAALETADDDAGGIGGLFMDFLRGGLRIVTGRVADSEPERYRLRTPVATIGVRGTEFAALLCRGGEDCPGDDETDAESVEPAARVLDLRGVVEATGANGATRVVDAGDGVYRGDTVETRPDAWAVLLFTDGSKVSLQPGTRFRLDEWEFDRGGTERGSALLNLLRGGLRVLTGLIGDETPDEYRVRTPVATIGVRGTGFDLFCVGTCVNPDATPGAVEGDGLFINTWDGTAVAELEGTVAEFAAGETGFMANSVLPPVRLPSLPPALQDLPAPRPDRVLRQLPEGTDRLYTEVEDGAIDVQGATGDALAVGAGSAAIVDAGGPAIPVSPVGVGDTGGVGTGAAATIGAAFSALVAREFDLATPYAGVSTGRASVDDNAFENRLRRDHPTASVNTLRNADIGGRVFGGFRMLEALAFEVGYVDLGELNSEIDPGSENESELGQTALDEHPIAATGLDFSTLVRTPVGINTWAFARAGVFVWEADVATATSTGTTFSKSVDGTDPVVGGGVDHKIGPGLHARAEWIHYRLEPDQVNYVGAGLVWSFP